MVGNCLAARIALLLEPILTRRNKEKSLEHQWQLVKVPPVYNLPIGTFTLETATELVHQCDVIFTQPLFKFGTLNTGELQKRRLRVHTFSAPNFDAYFPDIIHPGKFEATEKFAPPLEWHSRIFLEFKAAKGNMSDLEAFYLSHPLFHEKNLNRALDKSWAAYERREKNVEIGTLDTVRRYYNSEILFYTWKHPADRIIRHILSEILLRLDFSRSEVDKTLSLMPFQESSAHPETWSYWGFGFNAWPVIARHTRLYNFPGREFFRIHGRQLDILTAGLLWSQYYEEHPGIFENLLNQSFK